MKKILSIFLISAMILSLFTGVTAFAAAPAQNTPDDGGLLWHKFDFETNTTDSINSSKFTNDNSSTTADDAIIQVNHASENGENFAKMEIESKDSAMVLSVASTLGTCSDRYIVIELDFEKTATSAGVYFYLRDDSLASSKNKKFFNTANAAIDDWTHYVLVVDKSYSATQYSHKTYTVENGVYTQMTGTSVTSAHNAYTPQAFRIEITGSNNDGAVLCMDNLEIKSYKNFYETVNAAASPETIVNAISTFSNLNLITGMPVEYAYLTSAQKLQVAQNLINKNFANDDAVVTALTTAVDGFFVGTKELYSWDFENGNLNGKSDLGFFNGNIKTEGEVVYSADPADGENGTAKSDLNINPTQERLTFTNDLKSKYESGDAKIVVYDMKIKSVGGVKTSASSVSIGSSSNRKTLIPYSLDQEGRWVEYKVVVDTTKGNIIRYATIDGSTTKTIAHPTVTTFDFNRISQSSTAANGNFVVYFDNVSIKYCKAVYEEINETAVENIPALLANLENEKIITLPEAYQTADKAAFAQYLKSTTYTSDVQVNEAITLYLSNDELVVLSADATADALNGLKLAVKKDGVSLASSKLVVAAYDGTELVSVKVCDVAADGTVTGLGVDISNADSVKLMLVNNTQAMTPAVKATLWK